MTDEDLKFYRGVASERDQLRKDVSFLLALTGWVQGAFPGAIDEEDVARVTDIRSRSEASA